MTNLKNNIIEKIKEGQVAMKPRWYFMLQTALWVAAVLLVAMISIYLLSFIFFVLHQSGLWLAPSFGWSGLLFFVVSSPWLIILLVGFFLLLLYLLVTHFSFSYRKPLVYSLIGTVMFVVGVSSFIQYTMIHERMRGFSQRHQLPGLAPLYSGIADRHPEGMLTGTITRLTENGFEIRTQRSELVSIVITNKTKQPNDNKYKEGDQVMIIGKKNANVVEAFGVRPYYGTKPFPLPPRMNR